MEGLSQIQIATTSVEPLEPPKLKSNSRVISLRATISRYPIRSMYIGIALLGALLGLTTVYWMLGPDHIQKVLYVQATFSGWQASGIEVKRGQTLGIRASGTIVYWRDSKDNCCAGPDGNPKDPCPHIECIMRGTPAGALIGEIGQDTKPFLIGSHLSLVTQTSEQLYMAVNDPFTSDNSGNFEVTVDVR
jgi:hypothetical protein